VEAASPERRIEIIELGEIEIGDEHGRLSTMNEKTARLCELLP
jgi:hypothetical protein